MQIKKFTESCFEYKKKLLLSTRRIISDVFQRQNDLYQADVGFIQNRRRVQRIMKLSLVLKEIPRSDDFDHVINEIHERNHFGENYSKWHKRQRVFAERVLSQERQRRNELDIECPALVKLRGTDFVLARFLVFQIIKLFLLRFSPMKFRSKYKKCG